MEETEFEEDLSRGLKLALQTHNDQDQELEDVYQKQRPGLFCKTSNEDFGSDWHKTMATPCDAVARQNSERDLSPNITNESKPYIPINNPPTFFKQFNF